MTGDTSEDYARRRVRELTEEIKRLHADVLYEQERNANNVHAYQDRIDAALALHSEWGIYDECGHDHTEEDVRTGKAIDVDVGFTCEEGKVQSVCRECDTDDGDATEATEDGEWPCPTVKALKGEK